MMAVSAGSQIKIMDGAKHKSKKEGFDVSPFKLDIDELIKNYDEGNFKSLADFKRLWLGRKFSFIFDARPSKAHVPLFMQTLFTHCIGHIATTYSLSHRLGGLYCLYCLYEIQPFKPVFKIYISLGELRRLKALVVDAKEYEIQVVYAIVRRLLEKKALLFGFVDMNDYSETESVKELIRVHNAHLRKMHEKLLANTDIERYLHMDMGMEIDLVSLTKIAADYAEAKNLAISEAEKVTDVGDVKHIALAENSSLVSDIEMIVEDWKCQKEMFNKQTGMEETEHLNDGEEDDSTAELDQLLYRESDQEE